MKNKCVPFFLFLVCLACSSEQRGLAELKRLCEKDVGIKIYKKVEVSGYFDASTKCHHCWNSVVLDGYQYIEFCNDAPPDTYAINKPGCWRVSRITREGGQCNERIDQKLHKKKSASKYKDFIRLECLKTEKVEKPISRYHYFSESAPIDFENIGNIDQKISYSRSVVTDSESNEILAEAKSYLLTSEYKSAGGPDFDGCPTLYPEKFKGGTVIPRNIIKPIKIQN